MALPRRAWARGSGIVFGYALLSAWITWPLVTRAGTSLAGDFGDLERTLAWHSAGGENYRWYSTAAAPVASERCRAVPRQALNLDACLLKHSLYFRVRGNHGSCGCERGPFVFLPVAVHSEVAETCCIGLDSGCFVKTSLEFGGWKLAHEHIVTAATKRADSPKRNKQFLSDNQVDVFRA